MSSRRLVLRVPNPNAIRAAPAPAPPPVPDDVASESGQDYSGGDAMDVDEAGEMEDEGEEVEDEGEVGDEGEEIGEYDEGNLQDQEQDEGENGVDVEGEGPEEGEGQGDEPGTSERGRGRGRPRGRGRGRGRGKEPSDATAAPKPRGRGRGRPRGRPRGSGRGRGPVRPREGSPVNIPEGYTGPTPYRFVNGQPLFFKNDELTLDDDEKGDQKIDARGNLLGGREFKAPTFGSPWRDDPERQYMLSIDAARTSGFRDSLYYFRRNPQLVKLPLSQTEKDMLIDIGRLPNSLKSRSVTLVTVRSAYKVHGAKMIKNGRWVVDDYYEDRVLAEGKVAGELVGDISQEPAGDAEQHHAPNAAPTTSASGGVYRVGGPSTLYGGPGDDAGPGVEIRLAAVREADRELARMRRAAVTSLPVLPIVAPAPGPPPVPGAPPAGIFASVPGGGTEPLDGDSTRLERRTEVAGEVYMGEPPLGWYEPHTGVWHYRGDTQPTRAKLTHAPPTREALLADAVLGGAKVGSNSWGIASVKTFMEIPEGTQRPPEEFVWEG